MMINIMNMGAIRERASRRPLAAFIPAALYGAGAADDPTIAAAISPSII
jgi:hypothetical protein